MTIAGSASTSRVECCTPSIKIESPLCKKALLTSFTSDGAAIQNILNDNQKINLFLNRSTKKVYCQLIPRDQPNSQFHSRDIFCEIGRLL